jgi:hypothetical protein
VPENTDNVVPLPILRPSSLASDDLVAKTPRPAPPPAVAQVIPGLTAEEVQALVYSGEDPKHFVAIVAPVMQSAMQFADLQNVGPDGKPAGVPHKVVVFQSAVPIDPAILPPDASTMIDPSTNQPMLSQRMRKALVPGVPMMLRVVVRRSALSDEARAGVAYVEGKSS